MFDMLAADNVYDYLKQQEKAALNSEVTSNELFKRDVRLKALEEYAFQSAARQGIKARLSKIEKMVSERARDLDAIYDFNPLLIKGKVIPPVITEASDIYNLEDSTTIKTSDRIYQIKNQARFSSVSPNWRAYMQLPIESKAYNSSVFISESLMPKNETEKTVWLNATVRGWDSGVEQANKMLENNMKRLNRDYIGMLRFHQFVLQGKLTMPIISQYDLDNSNDGNTMVLNQQMLKITQLPQFENKWIRNPESRGFPTRGSVVTGKEEVIVQPAPIQNKNDTAREIKLKQAPDNQRVVNDYKILGENKVVDRSFNKNTLNAQYTFDEKDGVNDSGDRYADNNANLKPVVVEPKPKPKPQRLTLSKSQVDNSGINSDSVRVTETRTIVGLPANDTN